jgi:hypothetical protein
VPRAGSHLRRTPLHDELEPLLGPSEHGAVLVKDISFDESKREHDTSSPRQHAPPLFNENHPDAVDVFAGPCDLVIADARVLHAARHNSTDETRDLLLLWHSRPGGQNNRGAPWDVPDWYTGELPHELQTRPDDFESEGTRIPGDMLKPAAVGDPRRTEQLQPAAAAAVAAVGGGGSTGASSKL